GQETVLIPVRISNCGTHAVAAEGPGRWLVESRVVAEGEGEKRRGCEGTTGEQVDVLTTPLPDLLIPGRSLPAAILVSVPPKPGLYRVAFRLVRHRRNSEFGFRISDLELASEIMNLHAKDRPLAAKGFGPMLDEIRAALVWASRLQQLPDDYIDVTEGRLARWKRWIKRKLLGNFKHAYV